MLKLINVKNIINHFGQHTWFGTLFSMNTFTIFWKQKYYFTDKGSFRLVYESLS